MFGFRDTRYSVFDKLCRATVGRFGDWLYAERCPSAFEYYLILWLKPITKRCVINDRWNFHVHLADWMEIVPKDERHV